MLGDTIAAVSTALGDSGVGIVRISGPDALVVCRKIFLPKDQTRFDENIGFRLHYGQIIDPVTGKAIDEVLVGVMREPHSYTGEEVVEINCHGGLVAQRTILQLLLKLGIRLAEPGEFSKRAFINGRLDLAQAEAVIDLIRAKTDMGASSALEQLRGRLSEQIGLCRKNLLQVAAEIEAGVDFPEDHLDISGNEQLLMKLCLVRDKISEMLIQAEKGRIIRDGINIAIIGQPNVGKSSILNALLREDRAIVTEIPGTTRDVLEEYINVKGIPLKLIDTAGIRETDDIIEKMGVEKALNVLNKADIVLFVLEAGRELSENEKQLLANIPSTKLVVVVNKIDLNMHTDFNFSAPIFYISAAQNQGIEELEEGLAEIAVGKPTGETPVLSNVRHINAIRLTYEKTKDAIEALHEGIPLDLISIDVRSAWQLLGEITGESVQEDILDEIFSRFCIGK